VLVGLLACATQSPPELSAIDDQEVAAGEQVFVTVRIVENAPPHPKLQWHLAQTGPDQDRGRASAPAPENTLTRAELEDYLQQIKDSPSTTLLHAPQLLVNSGETAWVQVSDHDEGFRLEVQPTLNDDNTVTVRMMYDEWGVEPLRTPASEHPGGDTLHVGETTYTTHQADTKCVLATGMIGAPRRLLMIQAFRPQGIAIEAGPRQAEAAAAVERTHIEYYAVFWYSAVEPDLAAILPESRAVKLDAGARRGVECRLVPEGRSRAMVVWWRANAFFQFGGKDAAKLVEAGEPVVYDLPATGVPAARLDLLATPHGESASTRIGWTDLAADGTPDPAFRTGVIVPPDHAVVVSVPAGPGVWQMMLIRAIPADPDVFRGQTDG